MTIKEARTNAGLTLSQASKYLGIPQRTIEEWEAGRRKSKNAEQVTRKLNALGVMTGEGRESLLDGVISWDEAYREYLIAETRRISRIGSMEHTFYLCWDRIPESGKDKLEPGELAELVDAFYTCFGEGKQAGREDK